MTDTPEPARGALSRRRLLGSAVVAAGATTAGPARTAQATTNATATTSATESASAATEESRWHPGVRHLLPRMTLPEKIAQLNLPQVLPAGLVPPDSPVTSDEDRARFVAGTWRDFLGPGGGFFGLMNETVSGLIPVEHPRTPRQQAQLTNRLQEIAAATRLGIPLLQIAEGTNGFSAPGATIFPEGPGMGATWNPALVREVYACVAAEARSVGVHVLNTLPAELTRDPRLGRVCEFFGEDPFHVASLVAAVVQGVQGADPAGSDRAAASLCHFPAQTPNVGGLEGSSVEIGERALRQTHLPPWQAGFGAPGALMTLACQSTIDGVPTHGSRFLLTEVLRGELGFTGVVIAEGGGLTTLVTEGLAENQRQAGALALAAGVDVGITWEEAYLGELAAAVRAGEVPERLVDRAVGRVLNLKYRLGLFDRSRVDPDRAEATVRSAAHQAVSLRAARESIVLLKNSGDLLPLGPSVRRLAVIGPNADDVADLLGDYTPWPPGAPVATVLAALRDTAPDGVTIRHAKGCEVTGDDRAGIPAAVAAARAADVTVLVLGERSTAFASADSTDGESRDAADLELTGVQEELLKAVHATGTPVVLVLVNGRALAVNWAAEHVPAIVEAFLPGEFGGRAVAEVLFGEVNPSGRLPVTVPRGVGQLPLTYDHKRMRAKAGDYVGLSASPLYEFGFGLSYTTFSYARLRISRPRIRAHESTVVRVDVTNTGVRRGQEVVQLYLRDRLASVSLPERMLRGYAKVDLAPGETTTVAMTLSPRELALVDHRMRTTVEPGLFDVLVGRSCLSVELTGQVEVMAVEEPRSPERPAG
ncbi:glycoside hydrolase family 3 C-terminal domain-containing protein [Streptomyces sp. NPDC092369]|uniref:glycoside hydrolase family 3 C-terminal domain-containing protein n=1 Tax=Streptomyces sp. NPDC092369 TaxID=3366015 RepID=UPI00380C7000